MENKDIDNTEVVEDDIYFDDNGCAHWRTDILRELCKIAFPEYKDGFVPKDVNLFSDVVEPYPNCLIKNKEWTMTDEVVDEVWDEIQELIKASEERMPYLWAQFWLRMFGVGEVGNKNKE